MIPNPRAQNETIENNGRTGARAELEHIIADAAFGASSRRKKLLTYLVLETLAGRREGLNGIAIAQSVFGRDATFDHQNDPVVRVEARRLRHDLDRYYEGAGKMRPLRISIPKGGYVVQFVPQSVQSTSASAAKQDGQKYAPGMRITVVLAALLGLFMTTAWLIFNRASEQPSSASVAGTDVLELPKGPVVAVLPFLNISGSAEKQYISDGITQQIATELAKFEQLRVLPLGSLRRFNEGIADPHEIQRDFGAAYILEGGVRMNGDTIRITSRLIETAGSRYVWVKNFSEELTPTNIYDVQDAIAQEVAANLGGKYGFLAQVNTTLSKRKAPDSLEAYDCVLHYYRYQSSINPENHSSVRACLENAVVIEPDYAEAWAVLANLYMQEVRFGYGGDRASDASLAAAKRAAKQALEIDPQSTTGNIVLANLLFTEGDLRGFRDIAERALIGNPNDSDVLAHFGLRLALSGDWDHGLSLVEKAVTLNPTFPSWYRFAQVMYHYNRQEYQLALDENDKIDMPDFFWTHLMKAAAFGQLGRFDEARVAASQLLELNRDFLVEGRSLIKAWQFPEPLYAAIVDGLENAGVHLIEQGAKDIRPRT